MTVEATHAFQELQELEGSLAAHCRKRSENVSMGIFQRDLQERPQAADEFAAAALFPMSDQSSAITGQTLNVDGGMAFC